MREQRDLRKKLKSAPIRPEIKLIVVKTNVSCFSRKSGSGHALLTHSIGQIVIFFFGNRDNFQGGVGGGLLSLWCCMSDTFNSFVSTASSTNAVLLAFESSLPSISGGVSIILL